MIWGFFNSKAFMKKQEYISITTELIYLRKEIEELKRIKSQPVEIHHHYTFDYSALIKLLKEKGYI